MGTVVNLTVVNDDPQAAQAAIDDCLNRMQALEEVLSRFKPDSELSQLNREGSLAQAHPALLALMGQAQEIGELSGGAFDVTVKPLVDLYQYYQVTANTLPPDAEIRRVLERVGYRQVAVDGQRVSFDQPGMAVTLDSIAKGYIVDAGVAVLRGAGFQDVLVEAGGDLLASGYKDSATPWQIGIQSPRKTQSGLLASFSVKDNAVATSGDYAQPFTTDLRQHHILDPRTGYSAPELASVTVTAPTAAMADGLATAVMVLGPQEGLAMVDRLSQTEACLMTKETQLVQTAGFGAG